MSPRILFVEDSADDLELMLRRLREAGIEPQWDRVESEAALREALADERWELALVDYDLPGFAGPTALAVLAEAAPDVPAEILSKPGRISEVEFNLIKQHPASGFDILEAIDFGRPVAEMVLQHHERLDGSGYPRALVGADILPEAKILAVAAACFRLIEEQGFEFTP